MVNSARFSSKPRKSAYGRFLPGLAIAALCISLGLCGFLVLQRATNGLLEADAREDAENWNGYLSRSLPDLPAIARGADLSEANLNIFRQSMGMGRIYAFRVYDRDGQLKLRSDDFLKRLKIGRAHV